MHSRLFVVALVFFGVGCGEVGTLTVEHGGPVDIVDVSQDGQATDDSTSTATEQEGPPVAGEDPACPAGLMECDGACVDATQSDDHCGACGNACGTGTECASSECACTDGGDLCAGACVNLDNDPQNCGTCGNSCTGGMACVAGGCMALTEVEGVLAATNAVRATGADCGQYGMMDPAPPLQGDPNLNEAAQVHAVDMAENNFFSHTGSDNSSFVDRVRRTGFQGAPMGENIAGGGLEAAGVVQRWVDSDGHCRNLMNPSATKLGVGFVRGGPYGSSWVQVFGR